MVSGFNRYGIPKGDWAAVKCEKSATSVKPAADLWYNSGHEDGCNDMCACVRDGIRGDDGSTGGACGAFRAEDDRGCNAMDCRFRPCDVRPMDPSTIRDTDIMTTMIWKVVLLQQWSRTNGIKI